MPQIYLWKDSTILQLRTAELFHQQLIILLNFQIKSIMTKINIDELKLKVPFKLIEEDLKKIHVMIDLNVLHISNKLNIENKSLLNSIIEDLPNKNYYRIVEIIVLSKKNNPWWRLGFFNPIYNIKLDIEKIEDEKILQKLYKLSKISNIRIMEGMYDPN
jgi:hypothetical protein